MTKIDIKDKEILYQLDLNSRQSFSQLGKKVGIHKDVASYRVKRLQEWGIIKNFYTCIDTSKLGYIRFRFYLCYECSTKDLKKKIIKHFIKECFQKKCIPNL